MREEIEKIIKEKLYDIEYENTQTRMSEEFYMKNDAKIEVLEEILRLISDSESINSDSLPNCCEECSKELESGTVFCSADCRRHYYS